MILQTLEGYSTCSKRLNSFQQRQILLFIKYCGVFLNFTLKHILNCIPQVSLMNAAKLCFNLNMTILTINNLAMISSYFNLLEGAQYIFSTHAKTNLYGFVMSASAKASVWTSASAEGESCDSERQFAWCAIGVVLNESDIKTTAYWTKEPEAKATSDKCVTLNYDAAGKSVGLLAADCSAPKQLLCQVSLKYQNTYYCGRELLLPL